MSDVREPFSYYPKSISLGFKYEELIKILEDYVSRYTYKVRGKECNSWKKSGLFVFGDGGASSADGVAVDKKKEYERKTKSTLFSYSHLPTFYINGCEELEWVQRLLEKAVECVNSDPTVPPLHASECVCVMIHVYEDGTDKIGWHSDREGGGGVVSVNFGASRKFRLRRIKDENGKTVTKGWSHEFSLGHRDVFYMHPENEDGTGGCQSVYKHCVPREKKVKESRVNMTFRW